MGEKIMAVTLDRMSAEFEALLSEMRGLNGFLSGCELGRKETRAFAVMSVAALDALCDWPRKRRGTQRLRALVSREAGILRSMGSGRPAAPRRPLSYSGFPEFRFLAFRAIKWSPERRGHGKNKGDN